MPATYLLDENNAKTKQNQVELDPPYPLATPPTLSCLRHGVLQYIGVAAGVTPLLATVGHFDYCVKLPSVWRGVQMCASIHARSFW